MDGLIHKAKIRANNPGKRILVILDNFTNEWVYLPVYSPHLDAIEHIWKIIKRTYSLDLEVAGLNPPFFSQKIVDL